MPERSADFYKKRAADIRRSILSVSHRAKTPHIGSCLSIVDVLTALYFGGVLRMPSRTNSAAFKQRDRLILSKGHASLALYATLVERGLLPKRMLDRYKEDGTELPGHLAYKPEYGLEAATGSLGHGLPIATGMALAAKRDSKAWRTFAILSDGECDEGSTWEAIMAAAQWKLDNLIVIVDYNKIQSFGTVKEIMNLEPFALKWESFNWSVHEMDGHDIPQLVRELSRVPFEKDHPSVIIAHTAKGKGVSFMEHTVDWHYKNLTESLLEQALKELRA